MLEYVLLGFYAKTVPTKHWRKYLWMVIVCSKPKCLLKAHYLQDTLFQNNKQLPSYSKCFEGTFFLQVYVFFHCFPSQPKYICGRQLAGNIKLMDWLSFVSIKLQNCNFCVALNKTTLPAENSCWLVGWLTCEYGVICCCCFHRTGFMDCFARIVPWSYELKDRQRGLSCV